ncbi:MAG: hypothetical protein KKD13_00070, partial [Candidatus Margulisbacteria bacterium]|nr:hypothetical protein [Candidatus Margulisiibacteriota bacterium]
MNKENFYPLTYLREAEALRCGALTLREHPEINHPWELISGLKGALEKDLKVIGTKIKGLAHPTAVLYAPENILIEEGAQIDAVYYCPHHPDEKCDCRKPKSGMFIKAADDLKINLSISYMIGDKLQD